MRLQLEKKGGGTIAIRYFGLFRSARYRITERISLSFCYPCLQEEAYIAKGLAMDLLQLSSDSALPVIALTRLVSQSTALTRVLPELVQHFRL
jgi:hypothetical protein